MFSSRRKLVALLCVGYGLIATSLDVAHDHGRRGAHHRADCRAECREEGLHISGHQSEDLSQPHPQCLACVARGQQHVVAQRVELARARSTGVRLTEEFEHLALAGYRLGAPARAPPMI